MSNTILSAQIRVRVWAEEAVSRLKSSESGQSSAEYAGIIVVAVVLVGALITAATDWGKTITDGITTQIGKLFGGGA